MCNFNIKNQSNETPNALLSRKAVPFEALKLALKMIQFSIRKELRGGLFVIPKPRANVLQYNLKTIIETDKTILQLFGNLFIFRFIIRIPNNHNIVYVIRTWTMFITTNHSFSRTKDA